MTQAGPVTDVVAPGLDVLFCGINPGMTSARVGHHFAHPGNRFWKALHLDGSTLRSSAPRVGEQAEGLCGSRLWVLPNPSGIQARYQLDDRVEQVRTLGRALRQQPVDQDGGLPAQTGDPP